MSSPWKYAFDIICNGLLLLLPSSASTNLFFLLFSLCLPACLASPSRCVCIGCFPPHSLFLPFLFFRKKKDPTKFRLFSMFLDYRSVCSLHTYIFCVAWLHGLICRADPTTSTAFPFFLLAAYIPLTMWLLLLLQTPKEYFIYISMNLFVVLFSSVPYFAPILSLFIRLALCTCWNSLRLLLLVMGGQPSTSNDGNGKTQTAVDSWVSFSFHFSASIPTRRWSPTRQSTWPRASTSASCVESIFRARAACGSTPRPILANVLLFGKFPKVFVTQQPQDWGRKNFCKTD